MENVKLVAFKLGEDEYGVDIDTVQSIEQIQPITRVPNVASYIKGVINLRGKVTPIIDLRSRLGIKSAEYTEETRVIITKLEDVELGWIVDETTDVFEVNPNELESASANGLDSPFFGGIANLGRRLIIELKLEALMNKEM